MSTRTITSAIIALGALILVTLAPTGAAAHGVRGGHTHAAPAKHATVVQDRDAAPVMAAEIRVQSPLPADQQLDLDCGDRGCCSNGHCSACGTALAPASWAGFALSASVLLLNPNAYPLSSLAREGPPRPPKSIA